MQNNFYLKKIYLILEDNISHTLFYRLRKQCKEYNLKVEILSSINKINQNEDCLIISDLNYHTNLPFLYYSHKDVITLEPTIKYIIEDVEAVTLEYLEHIYRRYLNIPWDILETERCMIRETIVEDVNEFYNIYKDSSITLYMEDLYKNIEDEINYIEKYIEVVYKFYEFGVWTILDKENGNIIGRAGLSVREECILPELGFVIRKEYQHKGIAYEVCEGILEYAKRELEFEKVQVLIRVENKISLSLCNKLRFELNEEIELNGEKYFFMTKEL